MDNAEDIPPEQLYQQLLPLVVPTFGALGLALAESNARRGWHLFRVYTELPSILPALAALDAYLEWLATTRDLTSDLKRLLQRARQDLHSGMEAVLAHAAPRSLDNSRDLMEIEFLFYDFARDSQSIDRWQRADEQRRNQEFSFGQLRQREERTRGVPVDEVLPDRFEYRAHSAKLHPSPAGQPGPNPDELTSLFLDLSDLIEHGCRVISAAHRLLAVLNAQGPPSVPPRLEVVQQALDEFRKYTGRLADGAFAQRPTSEPLQGSRFDKLDDVAEAPDDGLSPNDNHAAK